MRGGRDLVRAAALAGGILAGAACSGEITAPSGAAGSSGSGGASSSSSGAGGAASASASSGAGAGGSSDCEALAEALAKSESSQGACTTVVRLDYATKAVLGFQILCGPYAKSTEAEARATAQADSGFGQSGQYLSGPSAADELVFYETPGDFGGASAVSSRTGLTVFGGSIWFLGKGQLVYPKSWLPASALGSGCSAPMVSPPPSRGFDLRDTNHVLGDADVKAAVDVVWHTALPAAYAKVAYVFDAVVLLYPRTLGEFDPATAEWIVLVNSGYLE